MILTDKSTISAGNIDGNLWIHVVDPKTTTDNAAGSSFKVQLKNLAAIVRGFTGVTVSLNQSGTSDPTATAMNTSTLSGPIVWTYSAVGTFIGTLTGAFTSGKTVVQAMPNFHGRLSWSWTSANVITLYTYDSSGTLANGLLTNQPIEVKVLS